MSFFDAMATVIGGETGAEISSAVEMMGRQWMG